MCSNDSGGKIPQHARLRQRLERLRDPLSVSEVGHVLLSHARSVWADQESAPERGRTLSPDQIAEIEGWLEAGDKQRDVAVAYRCSLSTVKRISRLMHPKAPRPELAPEIRAEIQRLHHLGLPISRIAEVFALPYNRVRDTVDASPVN